MKTRKYFDRQPDRGFALVIVLGILVLLVVLAVGFVGKASVERTAASGYNAAVNVRLLADTAVSLVQGQINTATTQGFTVAWASQPGMIRTFDASGDLLHAYKLYSANNLISDTVDLGEDVPPGGWASLPAVWTDLNAPVSGNYPILDALATAEGFALSDATPKAGYSGANSAPMPVRWLYVLRDGSLVAPPPESSGNTVVLAGAGKNNPVVGRIAYWTDDDTSKVNINTASEGTYWDTPRFETQGDRNMGMFQPAQGEFQRYPGHPAMVSLSSVFTDLTADQIYNIVPRVSGGGSNRGTEVVTSKLTPDQDRLYASIDELIFDATFNGERGRNPGLTKTQLERARFFLTARSRAPEINLFNLPRVACWPIFEGQTPPERLTTHDRLIAFCSSINGYPYYFQRKDADSPSSDINISRNQQLYRYLQYLTSQSIPGEGGNFLSKYGDDRNQILTEIFDYVRSTNLYDETLVTGSQFTDGYLTDGALTGATGHGSVVPSVKDDTRGFGRYVTLSELAIGFICTADAANAASNTIDSDRNPTVLNAGERRVQAIIVPEFFCAMVGFGTIVPDFQLVIKGLETLKVNDQPLGFPASESVDYVNDPFDMESSSSTGGVLSYRYFGHKHDGINGPVYPYISAPIAVSGTSPLSLTGGDVTVEIRGRGGNPVLQTLKLHIPDAPALPLPALPTTGLSYSERAPQTSARAWWSFRNNGLAGVDRGGRLRFLYESPGHYQTRGNGVFFRREFDVVRSIVPRHGDYRLIAATETIDDSGGQLFIPHPHWNSTTERMACYLSSSAPLSHGQATPYGTGPWNTGLAPIPRYVASVNMPQGLVPDMHGNATGALTPQSTGDFDNGVPVIADGPYINKPDEGFVHRPGGDSGIPYYTSIVSQRGSGDAFFSPNRQVPSPGMFGSLPSRVKAGVPWTTLLFRPQTGHWGARAPADHYLLDLFWMPVVEPYAISEPFSTAGKINMNFQILPFTYITRSTALMALLKSEKMAAISNTSASTYKNWVSPLSNDPFRRNIDAAQTLSQFTDRFNQGKIFLSASEICDLHIVPDGQTPAGMEDFWTSHRLTGENVKERIYTTLYPRLTTKSNTYTVHFRAQALRKLPTSPADRWEEGKDQVVGEYRGSTTIERFLPDPLPNTFRDYAAAAPDGVSSLPTLDTFYRWRVVENKQFAP